MKRFLAAVCAVLALTTHAAAVEVAAPSAILMEKETGTVLFAKDEHAKLEPASVTKVMTLLLVMEAIDAGTLQYDTVITASAHACSMGGSQIWLKENEQMTVDEMLKAVCVVSANDCAVALAEAVAGSEAAFVERMNQAAEELGLEGSHFSNATGLDAADHYMTARDLGTLARRLVEDHPEYLDYSSQAELEIGGLKFRNLNRLVGADPRVLGLKTGTTRIGGNNLVTYARQGEESCYIVLLDSVSETRRFAETQKLLDLVFGGEG